MASPTQRSLSLVGLIAVVTIVVSVILGTTVAKTTTTSSSNASATSATCQQVVAALSDGPDPDVDPVGYALAQIKPLAAVTSSNSALASAVQSLDVAYTSFFDANGDKGTKALVTAADKRVDRFCPGASN